MRFMPLILAAFVLAACGKDPDARTTKAESNLAAKAVADVDAAMADANKAKPPTPAP
ncbi:MAG: hypothetical protein ACOYLS_10855 [Polymorphobacter sp.]